MTIPITPETVALVKDILMSGIKGKYPAFDKCFVEAETVRAKHLLYQDYVERTGCQIPKVFIYIVMDDILGMPHGKAEEKENAPGCLGYRLRLADFKGINDLP